MFWLHRGVKTNKYLQVHFPIFLHCVMCRLNLLCKTFQIGKFPAFKISFLLHTCGVSFCTVPAILNFVRLFVYLQQFDILLPLKCRTIIIDSFLTDLRLRDTTLSGLNVSELMVSSFASNND